ncbi:DUF4097 family beta strand repeat-containing protein [Caldanaerobacter subterraneus]|uniref:DUF4097 and DUF4098 domain-containing protein YvlB n=1 Tax=Caldanaerobacter subterraneus TaxID=911092 RepID=A0A4R2KA15_9THEO|nr:DUF4097 family beta strand repeat-containing protein [Caldanaerobacter subterraneus]TCO66946.1 DUF4097 and DUF4098 domain-containing protein YvlB [Caldanaerobacter subterraneus]
MEEEKMVVLRMLEEGKITAEEAAILLEALEGRREVNLQEEGSFNLLDKFKERMTALSDIPKEVEKGLDKIEEKIEGIKKKDFGTSIADRILDFIWEGREEKLEKDFEFKDVGESISLKIAVANGNITLKRWDKDYIRTKVEYAIRSRGGGLDVKYEENYLKIVGDKGVKKAEIEVYLPAVKCDEVKLETVNGEISAEDLKMKKVALKSINSDVDLKDVCLEEADISTVNGDVSIHNLKVDLQKVFLKIDTINGDVEVKLEDKNVGVYYKLKTIAGDCSINLPGTSQATRNRHYLKGNTKNYRESEKKLEIHVNSVSGDITLE